MFPIIAPLIFALTLTLLTETIVYYFLKPQSYKFIITVLVMNTVSNLVMNIILTFFLPRLLDNYYLTLLIAELFVVGAEIILICLTNKTPIIKTILFSLLANAVSLALGLINNEWKIINTQSTDSFWFSALFVLLLCIALYVLFVFVPFNKKNRQPNEQGNREDNPKD